MQFDSAGFWSAFGPLLQGLVLTVELTVTSMTLGVIVGWALALLRMSPRRMLSWPATVWVEFWRYTPVLLQLYWIFYVMPGALGVTLSPFVAGLLGLTGSVSAFLSEMFRAGTLSIRSGQWQAAYALGMNSPRVFLRIIFPQAMSRVMPSVASTWVSLFKDTSLVSTIAVSEIAYQALKLRTETYQTLEVLSAMALLYLALGYPQAKATDWIHRRFEVKE